MAGTETPKRRLDALRLMERLARQEIEARVQDLGRLRGELARLSDEKALLTRRMTEEVHITSLEAAPYLGEFLRSARTRIAALDLQIEAVRPRLEALEAEVAARFREMRSYETVRLAAEAANRALREKRAEDEAADLVLMRWRG